jgi:hypothetical protein
VERFYRPADLEHGGEPQEAEVPGAHPGAEEK